MDRIRMNELEAVVRRINQVAGTPEQPYIKEGDKYVAQIGCYHLSGAYGGYALHQMVNESGGCRDVLRSGHMPKRELYERMHAFVEGLVTAKEGSR